MRVLLVVQHHDLLGGKARKADLHRIESRNCEGSVRAFLRPGPKYEGSQHAELSDHRGTCDSHAKDSTGPKSSRALPQSHQSCGGSRHLRVPVSSPPLSLSNASFFLSSMEMRFLFSVGHQVIVASGERRRKRPPICAFVSSPKLSLTPHVNKFTRPFPGLINSPTRHHGMEPLSHFSKREVILHSLCVPVLRVYVN